MQRGGIVVGAEDVFRIDEDGRFEMNVAMMLSAVNAAVDMNLRRWRVGWDGFSLSRCREAGSSLRPEDELDLPKNMKEQQSGCRARQLDTRVDASGTRSFGYDAGWYGMPISSGSFCEAKTECGFTYWNTSTTTRERRPR